MTIESIFGTIENLDCKEIAIEFSYRPYQISLLNDELLFFVDRINSKLLSIYDLKTQAVLNSVFDVGQGPNELLPGYHINPVEKDSIISILQRSKGLYTEYKLSYLLQNNLNPIKQIQFEGTSSGGLVGQLERVVKAKNKYICTGFYENGSVGIYDENGKLQKIVDTYPQYISKIDNFERRYLFGQQAEVAYNQNSSVLIAGSVFSGEICFYRFQNSIFDRIGYYNLDKDSRFERRIKSESLDKGIVDDDIWHVKNICTTDNFVYVLYFGGEMRKRNDPGEHYIFKFTHEGKAVKCYKINKLLIGICVSNDDKTIYSIALSDNFDYVLAQIDID